MRRFILPLGFLLVGVCGCSTGRHKTEVQAKAAHLEVQRSVANAAVSAAASANSELAWATYYVDIASAAAFTAYDASSGYYTVKVYSNATEQIRYEDSAGDALAVMGTASPFSKNAGLAATWKTTRVRDTSNGKNVTRDITAIKMNGTVQTGVTLANGTVNTITNIVTPLMTWLPYTGTLTGGNFSIVFSTGVGGGTITDSGVRMNVLVTPTGTGSSSTRFRYTFSVTTMEAAAPTAFNPVSRLGYGNE